jgi:hypothetical protein
MVRTRSFDTSLHELFSNSLSAQTLSYNWEMLIAPVFFSQKIHEENQSGNTTGIPCQTSIFISEIAPCLFR